MKLDREACALFLGNGFDNDCLSGIHCLFEFFAAFFHFGKRDIAAFYGFHFSFADDSMRCASFDLALHTDGGMPLQ